MSISKIQLFSVPVSDQDRAKAFYVDVLGWELVNDMQMGPDQRWVQVRPRGAETSVTLVTWFPQLAPGSLQGVVLETDDLEAEIASLEARGLHIPGGIEQAPWGRWVTLSDPDGNAFVLQTTAAQP